MNNEHFQQDVEKGEQAGEEVQPDEDNAEEDKDEQKDAPEEQLAEVQSEQPDEQPDQQVTESVATQGDVAHNADQKIQVYYSVINFTLFVDYTKLYIFEIEVLYSV